MKTTKEKKMKIKKIVAGTYEVTINNSKFEIYQNLELHDKGWELRVQTKYDTDWIETFPTLNSAKEFLAERGHTFNEQENA